MDDSNFGGVYIDGDFWMSKTLYPHEQMVEKIYDFANGHPVFFTLFCYYIFPIITLIFEMFLLNYMDIYINTHHLIRIQNDVFIAIGLNVVSFLILISIACGAHLIYKLALEGEKW